MRANCVLALSAGSEGSPSPPLAKGLYPASEKDLYLNAPRGTMRLTEKHIECAHLCARLEVGGQDTKVMAQKWGVTRATI